MSDRTWTREEILAMSVAERTRVVVGTLLRNAATKRGKRQARNLKNKANGGFK